MQDKPKKPTQPKSVQSKPAKPSSPASKRDLPKPQPTSKPASMPVESKQPKPVLFSKPLQGFGYNPVLFQSKLDAIPPRQLVDLACEAFGEYRQELADDVKILQREMLLGPSANITKISLTIGKYFGEELAHLFKNETTQTRLFIEATKVNFNSLDEESQIKEVLKLGYSVIAPGTAAKAMGKAGVLIKKINKINENVPVSNIPKSFMPAYNEIRTFSVKSALDGALYPREKLVTLVNYLDKRGVHVYGTNAAPCFIARKSGAHHIYLPENPTVLQVKHELSHWLDFKTLGFDKYAQLSTYQREKMVLDRLKENRIWDDLNKIEKDFSTSYVEKFKPSEKNRSLL